MLDLDFAPTDPPAAKHVWWRRRVVAVTLCAVLFAAVSVPADWGEPLVELLAPPPPELPRLPKSPSLSSHFLCNVRRQQCAHALIQ